MYQFEIVQTVPVAVDDGVQSVCDGEHRAVLELMANHLLHYCVRFVIYGRCGLYYF